MPGDREAKSSQDLGKIVLGLACLLEVAAAQFADQQAIVPTDEFAKDILKGDGSPADRHLGIASAEGQLVGLYFFVEVYRVAEIVMDMAMGDKRGNATHLVE